MMNLAAKFLACMWLVFVASNLQAQSLLDQLEQRVRAGLELNSPKPGDNNSPNNGQPKTGEAKPPAAGTSGGKSESELPAPNKNTPPPIPTPPAGTLQGNANGTPNNAGTANRGSSILEAPLLGNAPVGNAPANGLNAAPAAEDQGIYLGLEAESLAGGGIGARVVNVTDNSPAWRAGFKPGDVILAIDGFAITNLDTMVDRLSLRRPGDAIKVLLLRNAKNIELTAVLQNAALAQRIHGITNAPVPSPLSTTGHAWLGIVVADLSSAFRTQFGLRAYRAAAVTNVTKGSPADLLGIQPGDAIVGVDGRAIESARDLLDWMATRRPGDLVVLNVMRGARSNLVEVTLGTDPKFQPAAAARPAVPDPFGDGFRGELELGSVDNTVPAPSPTGSDPAEVDRLRSELRAARTELSSLEQRVKELEALLKQK